MPRLVQTSVLFAVTVVACAFSPLGSLNRSTLAQGYDPCQNPVGVRPAGCGITPALPPIGSYYPCRACDPKYCHFTGEFTECRNPPLPNPPNPALGCPASSVSSPAGQAEMCGPDFTWTGAGGPAFGAPAQEYANVAVSLTPKEVSALNGRGIYVFPQGETPWCAIAAASTVIRANTGRSPGIPALVAQINTYLTSIGQSDPRPQHGYTIDQAAELLLHNNLVTWVSSAGDNDPIGNLQMTSSAGPVIVGITLTATTTPPGLFGVFSQKTVYGQHAIVVAGVEGSGANRQVVIVDSIKRPTSSVWTNYYKVPALEFLKAWRVNGGQRPEIMSWRCMN